MLKRPSGKGWEWGSRYISKQTPDFVSKNMIYQLVLLGESDSGVHLNQLRAMCEERSDLVNAQDRNGRTLLHIAIQYGQVGAVDVLLEKGANCTLKDEKGNTPLDDLARLIASPPTGEDKKLPSQTKENYEDLDCMFTRPTVSPGKP